MELYKHLIASLLLAAVLYPFYGLYSLLALVGSLIDIDHYIFYVIKNRDLNPRKAYNFCHNKTYLNIFCILHNLEFIILLAALSLFIPVLFIAAISIAIHLLMDIIYIYHAGRLRKEFKTLSLVTRMIIK